MIKSKTASEARESLKDMTRQNIKDAMDALTEMQLEDEDPLKHRKAGSAREFPALQRLIKGDK